MTHPDILKMERDGCLYDEEKPVLRCDDCGHGIYEDDAYYDFNGTICCDTCILEYRRYA